MENISGLYKPLTNKYNKRVHRTIKMSPSNVNYLLFVLVNNSLISKNKLIRISKYKHVF